MAKIKRAVDRVLTLFPFEAPLYAGAGVDAVYVGHPLNDMLEMIPRGEAAREKLKLSPTAPIFTLMPGSRRSEIEHMADLFISAAGLISRRLPEAHFLVPLATRETRDMFENALYRNDAAGLPLTIMFGHSHEAMAASDAVLVASGTATLEAAILGRPMVIAYRMPPASYWLLKGKGYLPYYGLPNILCGKFVVPEFIQDDATPANLAQAMLNLYLDPLVRERLARKFSDLGASLGRNSANQAANAVVGVIENHRAVRR